MVREEETMKMNEKDYRRKIKNKLLFGILLGLILGIIITGVVLGNAAHNQRIKYEAVTELFMFSLNVSIYCAELNNMTTQEQLIIGNAKQYRDNAKKIVDERRPVTRAKIEDILEQRKSNELEMINSLELDDD